MNNIDATSKRVGRTSTEKGLNEGVNLIWRRGGWNSEPYSSEDGSIRKGDSNASLLVSALVLVESERLTVLEDKCRHGGWFFEQ